MVKGQNRSKRVELTLGQLGQPPIYRLTLIVDLKKTARRSILKTSGKCAQPRLNFPTNQSPTAQGCQ